MCKKIHNADGTLSVIIDGKRYGWRTVGREFYFSKCYRCAFSEEKVNCDRCRGFNGDKYGYFVEENFDYGI